MNPVIGKRPPHPRDYQLVTWPLFLTLRTWAKDAVQRVGAPVYLVGSALHSDRPRDIDLSFILPTSVIVERFGPLPPESGPELHAYMDLLHAAIVDENIAIQCAVEGRWTLDVKLCPDCWWADQDRLLLAVPNRPALIERLAAVEHARRAGWMDYLFSLCEMHADGAATIPSGLVERWQRQVRTPYAELSEREKESDRAEVLKTLHVLDNHGEGAT